MNQELSQLRIFKGVPSQLMNALASRVELLSVHQGDTLLELEATEEPFSHFYFVNKGQVKALGLDEDARVIPLNFFRKGEFFLDKSFSWRSLVATKMVALTDVEVFKIRRSDLKAIADQHAPLEDYLRALAEKIDYRNRIYSEDKYARSVLAFLIDNELTNASRAKITKLDKCIECNVCYKSCEDRHGFQRLERGYARFGVLDFAKSCLTCFYPTCIPSCPVDSVVYNTQKGEVEILDACIGCQACERACQYGAIKMFKVEPEDQRFSRFLAPNKKIKPKFIADKCNHCEGYEDMACITNCPTGAIIEVSANDLLENPRLFGTGEGSKPLPSLVKRSGFDRFLQFSYIGVLIFTAAWLSFETLALTYFPAISFLGVFQQMGWIPEAFELKIEHSSALCNFFGNLGFTFVFLAMTYPFRKSFPHLFKYLGSQPLWLDFHNFCGLLGAILITFHTGFYFSFQPATLGFISLWIVAFSGIFGRFLFLMIPRGVAGTELKLKEIEEEDVAISQKMDALFDGTTDHKLFIEKVVKSVEHDPNKTPTFWAMVRSVVQTWFLLLTFRFRMPRGLALQKRQLGPFLELLHDKIRLKRNVSFLALSQRLFTVWKFIHLPFVYIMTAIVFGHIIYNLLLNPKL